MPERPLEPAPNKMVREILTPDHTIAYFSELVDRDSDRFQAVSPIKRGTYYSEILGADSTIVSAYPTLRFLREVVPLGFSDLRGIAGSKYVKWMWSTAPDSESSYNSAISYLGEAVANPVYVRILTVKRDIYEATPSLALGSTLTSLIGVNITAGGTGYTTATGTIATGATVEFVISGGVLVEGIVTNEGVSVASGGSIPITGDGTGATATARIQPATAILTSQKKDELPDSDPMSLEFIRVTRMYETLPGPYLPFTRWDENLGPIQGRRRAVVNTGQVTTLGATSKLTYEARDGSSYVSWEIQESWSDGTGSEGNPAYPTLVKDFYDDERGAVQQTSQIVVATGSEVGSLTESGGTITRITYEPYADNPALLKKIIETWLAAGPSLVTQSIGQNNLIPEKYRKLVRNVETNQFVDKDYTFPAGLTGNQTQVQLAQVNIQQARLKIIEEIINSDDALLGQDTDQWGKLSIYETIVDEGTAIDQGFLVKKSQVTALGNGKSIKITARYPDNLADLRFHEQDYDQRFDVVVPTDRYYTAAGAELGLPRREIKAVDIFHDEVKTIGINTDVLDNFVYSYPGRINVDLPDLLTAVTALITKSVGAGASDETGSSSLSGNGSVSQSLRAAAQASASIVPEAYPSIKQFWGNNIPCDHYHFFLQTPTDSTAVLARLNSLIAPSTVSAWPKFNPEVVNVIMIGGKASVQATATSQGSDSLSDAGSSSTSAGGVGYSEEVGKTVRTLRISPTIHGTITVGGTTSDSQAVSATAESEAAGLGPDSDQTTGPFTVTSTVSPTTITATTGTTAWPTTGKYLYRIDPSPYRYGYIEFHCIVVDATLFPNA